MEAEGGEQKRVEAWDPLWEGRESVATSHPNAGKTPFKDGRVLTCRVGQGKEGRSACFQSARLLSKRLPAFPGGAARGIAGLRGRELPSNRAREQ